MLNSVPYVLISKPKAFFLVDHQVLKNAQMCSQANLLASYEAFFSILVENLQISEKSGPLIFRILNYSPDMTFFEFQQNLSAKYRSEFLSDFNVRHGVGTAKRCTFAFCAPLGTRTHQAHCPHTSGTSNIFRILVFMYFPRKNSMCLMCAYNVPDVCAYLGSRTKQKYSRLRF